MPMPKRRPFNSVSDEQNQILIDITEFMTTYKIQYRVELLKLLQDKCQKLELQLTKESIKGKD